ncbi:MAG: peroxiredoxin [Caulobacterales bacterium]
MSDIVIGKPAPAFKLPTAEGENVALSKLKGRAVVLYFYPRDDTPGCTAEAKDFSGLSRQFEKAGATVIGVSKDSLKAHEKFRDKHDLKVTLASDESGATVEGYGVWVEKNMYGKKSMGIERATFLIDSKGVVRQIWRKVKVPGHAEEVLKAVKDLPQ